MIFFFSFLEIGLRTTLNILGDNGMKNWTFVCKTNADNKILKTMREEELEIAIKVNLERIYSDAPMKPLIICFVKQGCDRW